jgi:WD40 repeat protein
MCFKRRRWFLGLFCLSVWSISFALLWFAVPIQPRVRLESADGLVLVGITSDSQKLITAGRVIDPDNGASYSGLTGPAQSWDLWNGHPEKFDLADKARPRGAFPGGTRAAEWSKSYIIWEMQIAPCGNVLAYDYGKPDWGDPSLHLLDLTSGKEVLCLPGATLHDRFSGFSGDGKWFAVMYGSTGARCRSVRVFATATGKEIVLNDPAHPSEEVLAFSFSPDGQFLAVTAKIDNAWHTHIWEIATARKLGMIPGWNFYVVLGPGAKTLAAVQNHGIVRLFDVATGRLRLEMKDHDMFTALTFARDGRTLTAYDDAIGNGRSLNRATTWDADTGRLLNRFDPPVQGFTCVDPNWPSHPLVEARIADGSPRIFVQHDRDHCDVYDVITGEHLVGSWLTSHSPVRVSPDNKTLVTHGKSEPRPNAIWQWIKEHVFRAATKADEDDEPARLQLWDLSTSRSLAVLDDYGSECLFSADGKTLVAQKDWTTIDVWDLPPRKPVGSIIAWSIAPPLLVLLLAAIRRRRLRRKAGAVHLA